jgi:hypothetical protein
MEHVIFVQSKHILLRLCLPNRCIGLEVLFSESSVHWRGNNEKYDLGLFGKRAKGLQHGIGCTQQLLK